MDVKLQLFDLKHSIYIDEFVVKDGVFGFYRQGCLDWFEPYNNVRLECTIKNAVIKCTCETKIDAPEFDHDSSCLFYVCNRCPK